MTLSSSDVAAIRGAEKALAAAFEASDPTAWVDFYTEDGIFVGPGLPAIEGRDALLSPRGGGFRSDARTGELGQRAEPGDQHYFADSSLSSYGPDAATLLTRRVLEFLQAR